MNTKDGYAKKSLTSARLLTADGGDTDNYLPLTGGTMTGALVTTALSVSGAATFSLAINGSILGNAATASRLLNARTISLTGAVTGSGSFDGSINLNIATTASSIALGNLSNVSISNPVTGNVLTYNGTNWVNEGTDWFFSYCANTGPHFKYTSAKSEFEFHETNTSYPLYIISNYSIDCSSYYIRFYISETYSASNKQLVGFAEYNSSNHTFSKQILLSFHNSQVYYVIGNTETLLGGGSWEDGEYAIAIYEGIACFYGPGNDLIASVTLSRSTVSLNERIVIRSEKDLTIRIIDMGSFLLNQLSRLSDVYINNPLTGLVLKYNGSMWVNDASATSLNVSLTTLNLGQILYYNGTNWTNGTNSLKRYSFTKDNNNITLAYNDDNNTLTASLNAGSGGSALTGNIWCDSHCFLANKLHFSFIIVQCTSMKISLSSNENNYISIYSHNNVPSGYDYYYEIHYPNGLMTGFCKIGDEIACEYVDNKVYVYRNKHSSHSWSKNYSGVDISLFIKISASGAGSVNSLSLSNIIITDFPIYTYFGGSTNVSYLSDLTDINISNISAGQILKYDGSSWVNSAASGLSISLNNLSNVNISGNVVGQFLKWNGNSWVNSNLSSSLEDLYNVNIEHIANGQVLLWDSNSNSWINATISGGSASQATSWAELGSGTNGTSQPTLSVSEPFPTSGASADNLPGCLYYPGSNKYCALPVIMDSRGLLFVAIPASLVPFLEDDLWKSISVEEEE